MPRGNFAERHSVIFHQHQAISFGGTKTNSITAHSFYRKKSKYCHSKLKVDHNPLSPVGDKTGRETERWLRNVRKCYIS